MKSIKFMFAGALFALTASQTAGADSLDTLPYAFSGGTPNLDLRLRYENVDQDSPTLRNAYANTLRARIGYDTGKWNDFDLFGEFEGTFAYFNQDYNSTTNGKTNQSVVADPDGTELNQAFLRYSGLPKTVIKLGRQRLNLDNQRFVGSVGWRQGEQTFDGYNVVSSILSKKSTINYTYISNVNTIFYTDYAIRGHLINANYAYATWLNLTGYAYLLDFKQNVAARRDSETFGGRLTGAIPLGPVKLLYTGEYAKQQRYADAPSFVDAEYFLIEPGLTFHGVTGKFGYEVLSSNSGTYGFQTPLATLHLFQGYADLFLNTPATGIRDIYGSLGCTLEKISLLVAYHDFKADFGGAHFGSEVDVVASRPLIKNLTALIKYANYFADDKVPPRIDTQKLIVQLEYKF